MAASSSATSASSSSVAVALKPDDLLDTADSATVDDSLTRWPAAAGIKSAFVVDQLHHPAQYHIPRHYTLMNPKDWAACDVPPEGYNAICVYAAAFEAGMRLPFHDLYVAVLRHYGLAPSQLMPNAWRYLSAFVLLCEDAGVEPMLPVFLSLFVLCADKGESMGRYHFKHYLFILRRPDSSSSSSISRRCRLFTGKMPPHPMWKDMFFFVRGPSTIPWPCSLKWGTPSMASLRDPVLTSDMTEAIHKLAHLAGDDGIDIMEFLSERNPPVGHLQIPAAVTPPQHVAVKEEATDAAFAAAASTEQTRKRKSPEPTIAPLLPPPSLQIVAGYDDRPTESPPPAPARVGVGVGLGHGELSVTGGEERSRTRSRMVVQLMQEVTADLDAKEQELQALRKELQMAKAQHETDVAVLKDEVQKAKAEASRDKVELQKAKAEHAAKVRDITAEHHRQKMQLQRESNNLVRESYDNGVRHTKDLVVTLYGQAMDLSEFTSTDLLSDSTPPLGVAPQPPQSR